jgi:hypothetical protein
MCFAGSQPIACKRPNGTIKRMKCCTSCCTGPDCGLEGTWQNDDAECPGPRDYSGVAVGWGEGNTCDEASEGAQALADLQLEMAEEACTGTFVEGTQTEKLDMQDDWCFSTIKIEWDCFGACTW